jgi:hypothetical protein
MTVNEKLSRIKTTIEEIKKMTGNLGNDNALEFKIKEMTKEISRLKKGIEESIDELDQILGEEDARS